MSTVLKQFEILEDEWRGCYRTGWQGLIVPEAFAHPAKYSRKLIERIYDHVAAEGWVSAGDYVVDPFGGVALGSFDAMRLGLHWTGIELEEKFYNLGNQNIALWNERYSRMPAWGSARLLNGDSRKLADILSAASLSVSSPPHCEGLGHGGKPTRGANRGRDVSLDAMQDGYGETEGQLGAMSEGSHSLAISSPPYANSVNKSDNGIDWDKAARPERWRGNRNRNGCQAAASHEMKYGATEGQLGAMREGDHAVAISSPPYVDSVNAQSHGIDWTKTGPATGNRKRGEGTKHEQTLRSQLSYGSTDAQLGAMPEGSFEAAICSPPYSTGDTAGPESLTTRQDKSAKAFYVSQGWREGGQTSPNNLAAATGEDFWSASRIILAQLYSVIVPGGHACFVVKAFVRNKALVDFPGQWAQLCEAVGFKLLHHHKALLVEHSGTQKGFDGDREIKVERKSFFRRLAESKGSPRIDHESVLCFEK